MKLMNNVSKEEKKLIRKMFWRSGAMYASVNPVTMGGGGFCYSMIPFINHFYKDNEEKRREALTRHVKIFQYDNSDGIFCNGNCRLHGKREQ